MSDHCGAGVAHQFHMDEGCMGRSVTIFGQNCSDNRLMLGK
jgi:hypothetical protein